MQLPEVERVVSWAETREMAVIAEGIGFDSIWLGDHLLYEHDGVRSGPWEAWTRLAGLAEVTSTVRFGPLVAALPFHPPTVLAKMTASVAEMGDGRFVLGVGAGWNRLEFDAFGLPYDHRVDRFAEAFDIVRRMLAGERVDFEGRYHAARGAELLPVPPGRIPIMIGSNGPRMLRIALPHCDMWNTWFEAYGNDPDRLRALVGEIETACRAAGRHPGEVELTAAHLVAFDGGGTRRSHSAPTGGEPGDLADALGRIARTGIGHVQLVLDPITPATIERAAEGVRLHRDSNR